FARFTKKKLSSFPRLKFSDAGDVHAGTERAAQCCRVVLNRRVTAAVRVECRRRKPTGRAAERGDRDATKNIAVTTTITNQHTLAKHEYDALEIRVATHRQRAGHDQKPGAIRQRAIAVDEREHRVIERIIDGSRTAEITIGGLRFRLQTVEIRTSSLRVIK